MNPTAMCTNSKQDHKKAWMNLTAMCTNRKQDHKTTWMNLTAMNTNRKQDHKTAWMNLTAICKELVHVLMMSYFTYWKHCFPPLHCHNVSHFT